MKSPFGPTVEARFGVLSLKPAGWCKESICCSIYHPDAEDTAKKNLFNKIIRLQVGDEISISTLSEWLVDNGFHRENQVADIGTFSIRGGIVDIYPLLGENPIRIEF